MSEYMTEPAAARVKFGSKDHQHLPPEWAEAMLRYLFEHNKPVFAKALQFASMGEVPSARRNGNGQG